MNTFYRFFRCAMMLAIMFPVTLCGQITPTTDTNGNNQIDDNEKILYLIQTNQFESFYMIPKDDNVSTANIPNADMLWYFLDAGVVSDTQYYYIINNSTEKCIYNYNGNDRGINLTVLNNLTDAEKEKCKFKLVEDNSNGTVGFYNIDVKADQTYYGLNKQSGSVNISNPVRLTNTQYIHEYNSKWKFIPYNGAFTWPEPPFTPSTTVQRYRFKIKNIVNGSYFISSDTSTPKNATITSTASDNMLWYFLEVGDSDPWIKYFYIVNTETEEYMYYKGTSTDGSNQSNAIVLKDKTSENEDRFQFIIVQTARTINDVPIDGCYTIIPKLLKEQYWNSNCISPTSIADGNKLGIRNGRGAADNNSHWTFEEVYMVEAPTITNNYDGTISLSTTTAGGTIYYTTNGDTPDNTSTVYSSAFSLNDATVIKAIAYLDSDFSAVTTYNIPQYATPTINVNHMTFEVTVTCTDATAIYYTTDGSIPTTSSTSYIEPFTVSPGTVVKAIATHTGYLNSDVATKYIQGDDYPRNYLTFQVLTGGTIAWKSIGTGMNKTISYRINGGSWTSKTSGSDVTINVNADDVVEFKGNNQTYATDKSNYSGFDGGTASFIISGNIMSLIYGDNFVDKTKMEGTYNFCSLFKQSKAVSAENLILPALTLTADCYRAMFSLCETLRNAPALPATTLATECYWYMFECCAITKAPDLLATNLVSKCYGHMFVGCSNLNYIKCLATSGINNTNLESWVGKKNAETTLGVAATGVFIKDENASWSSVTGTSGIPTGWDLIAAPVISCDGEYITMTCATEGASIYYRLNQTGDFSLYSSPIAFNSTTTVEAYSSKDDHTSYTVIITFEKYDNPFDESNRSLDSWTYGGTQVTLPYSVNGIDGHSSNYSKGNFTFETTINLYSLNPTYLWFQHADQSADIYVDDEFVTTHWGGYNAFFVDISNYVHVGTNRIKVILNNTTRNTLAPADGDFNFNATLGKAKLLTSPVMPSMDYGYDGFHVTATNVSNSSATVTVKTKIPVGASVVCTISDGTYNWTDTQNSTGNEQSFTTTIQNPHLWNGTTDPHLYNIKLEIYKDNELYHRYERPYGLRFYEYVIDETVNGNSYTGFLLNGQPYLLRGACMHHDIEGKANALTDSDIANDFAIIQELGCNFIRLAHYPHPKEVYDWCDQLGIIVQTEVPCVNKMQSTMPADYYTHLEGQYTDMVNQHYNHPCIIFWGLSNETTTNDKDFAKEKIEGYASLIKSLDPSRWVGYVMSHGIDNPSGYYNDPSGVDWFGCNIYVGWYIDQNSNNPTGRLNTRLNNTLARLNKPLAFSEYGGGGTQHCHSDDFMSTTTRGNNPRHDIEYQMWLHEGHIAAIKNFPQLLFTGQWQLFDIAVSSRNEGYTVCIDGENTSIDDNLRYLNNKGLVERDHKTKKDTYYLYKAWWNQNDKFVHICGKNYEKLNGRVIKCYTNDGNALTLFVNNEEIETVTVVDNIATFTARDFNPSDVIKVTGATSYDAFTFTNDFITDGNWNVAANWNGHAVPTAGSDVIIRAECTIPNGVVVQPDHIIIGENGSLTIADGGQLVSNSAVNATVEKNISAYTIIQNQGELLTDGWYFIASPTTDGYTPTGSMVENTYDLYRLNNTTWENYQNTTGHPDFTTLNNGTGYLYANSEDVTLKFTGTIKPSAASESVSVSTGWNLIGNPFTYNVYANRPFYKMNEAKTGVEAVSAFSTSPIAPCTGIVVEAESDGYVILSKEAPTQSQGGNSSLQITLNQAGTRGNAILDKAFVSFNEDNKLGKFYFGTQNTNIYIPQNGDEYAIAFSNCHADIPLNFKTTETGTYTISFEGEDMGLNGIYLIDMLSDQEIDLSANPIYTFIGSPADRPERFMIVFKGVNGDNDIFAYQNGSDVIVRGEGDLQIFDVTGRSVMTTTVSGIETIHVSTTGVYIFRLSGSEVKTQKIVIR